MQGETRHTLRILRLRQHRRRQAAVHVSEPVRVLVADRDRLRELHFLKRYALLTQRTSNLIHAMLSVTNSRDNCTGKYVNVIVATQIARDGLSLKNVQHIHLVGPYWNESSMTQAVCRGIRANSHKEVIEEYRNTYVLGDSELLPVHIYKHCARRTVDAMLYAMAEGKDRQISRVMRMAKMCAVNMILDYDRNVRDGDVVMTKDNDFEPIALRPYDTVMEVVNTKGYVRPAHIGQRGETGGAVHSAAHGAKKDQQPGPDDHTRQSRARDGRLAAGDGTSRCPDAGLGHRHGSAQLRAHVQAGIRGHFGVAGTRQDRWLGERVLLQHSVRDKVVLQGRPLEQVSREHDCHT